MSRNNIVKMFIDMDGNIAEYAAERVEDFYRDGYFLNLKPHQELLNFLKILNTGIEMYIVSACITDRAIDEKEQWLEKYFPEIPKENRIFTRVGESKAERIEAVIGHKLNKNCILFDDYSPNCIDWEKNGGTAIKTNNDINCSGKNWQGITMNIYKPHAEKFRDEEEQNE